MADRVAEVAEYDYFVSYASADREWVEGYLLDALEAGGMRCHSEASFVLGAPRLSEFERGVRCSKSTLLIVSRAYLNDNVAQFIDLLAGMYGLMNATWPVIPLVREQHLDLPLRLATLVGLDASNQADWPEVVGKLLRRAPPPASRPICPYPGLLAFSEADTGRFFGREHETEELVDLLRRHPLVMVIGPSGSGKSSLVFAGLVPMLRRSGLFGGGEWLVRACRPGERPLESLAAALEGDVSDAASCVAAVLAGQPQTRRLLLVIDQLEEVFTLSSAEAAPAFFDTLQQLSQAPASFIVLTARADFYAELMASRWWPAVRGHRYEVTPLDEVGLRAAILHPAENVDVLVDPSLVERLVADAGDEPGILPLVQETLVLLWEHLERRFLPVQAYELLVLSRQRYGGALGGTAARPTGLQAALARRADAALADLTPEQSVIARRVFLRLVQFGEGRADTRRQRTVRQIMADGDDEAELANVLEHLARQRLLTLGADDDGKERTVDLAHEALIGCWPTLATWMAERRDAERTRRQLEGEVERWTRLGRGAAGLAQEVEIQEALRWMASPSASDLGVPTGLEDLLHASQASIDAAEAAKDAARQRELTQAQALAAAEQQRAEEQRARAEDQTTASRRLRFRLRAALIATAVAVIGLMVAVTALIQTVLARNLADHQRQIALVQQYTADSVSQLATNPERSILSGLEAVDTAHFGGVVPDTHLPFGNLLSFEVTSLDRSAVRNARAALERAVQSSRVRRIWPGDRVADPSQQHIIGAAFDGTDPHIVIATPDGTLQVVDVTTNDALGPPLTGANGRTNAVAFSPDGSRLAAVGDDGSATIWELTAGRLLQRWPAHSSPAVHVAFSPDGSRLATATTGDDIRLWDAASGEAQSTLSLHTRSVNWVAFSPDGTRLASASADTTARIWDVSDLKKANQTQLLRGTDVAVNAVAFSRDGKLVATAGDDGAARIWDAVSGRQAMVLWHGTNPVWDVEFDPSGTRVVTASVDGTARVWNAVTGQQLFVLAGHTNPVERAIFSADGALIVTTSQDGTARVWDAASHIGQINQVAFNPAGNLLATASDDGTALIWDTGSGKQVQRLAVGAGPVNDVAFSSDGQHVATAGKDGLDVWQLGSNNASAPSSIHVRFAYPLNRVIYSPDGKFLTTAGDDGRAVIWDVSTNPLQQHGATLDHPKQVQGVAYSRDGQVLVTAANDGKVRQWNSTSGEPLPVPNIQQPGRVLTVVFSPDSKQLATASDDRYARLWDATTGSLLRSFPHGNVVTDVEFSPDGTRLATSSLDRTAAIWDVASGQQLDVLEDDAAVNAVAFSPDGKRLATSTAAAQMHIYILDDGELVRFAHGRLFDPALVACANNLGTNACAAER